MGKQFKYKLSSIPAIGLAGLLTYIIGGWVFNLPPTAAFIILVTIFFFTFALMGAVFIFLRGWEWPSTSGVDKIGWTMSILMLTGFTLLSLSWLEDSYYAIQLQNFGITTEAVIVDRWVTKSDDPDHYKFIYQWYLIRNDQLTVSYTNDYVVPIELNTETKIGTTISIRYLPTKPTISHIEERPLFGEEPEREVFFFIALNLFVMLLTLLTFWIERPKVKQISEQSYKDEERPWFKTYN